MLLPKIQLKFVVWKGQAKVKLDIKLEVTTKLAEKEILLFGREMTSLSRKEFNKIGSLEEAIVGSNKQ